MSFSKTCLLIVHLGVFAAGCAAGLKTHALESPCRAGPAIATGAVDKRLEPAATFEIDGAKGHAGGLTFDGAALWVSAQSGRDRLLRYSLEGKLLQEVHCERGGNVGGGMTYDGKHLYVLDYATKYSNVRRREGDLFDRHGEIARLKTNGTFVDATPLPKDEFNTFGLVSTGEFFFHGHSPTVRDSSAICKLDSSLRIVEKKQVPFYTRGLAWNGRHLWVSSRRRVYKLDQDLRIVGSYVPAVPLADITWAKGALWAVESNTNRLHRFALPTDDRGSDKSER